MDIKKAFTFDDIALVPQYNNVESRTIPSLKTWLTQDIEMGMPLIPSNMDSVIGEDLADIIIANGGIPIFHRFASLDIQMAWVEKYGNKIFISSGINDFDNVVQLLESGARGVCIDIAHGHSKMMIDYIRRIKNACPDKQIIAGNVCTAMGYQDLANAGADAVKIGIGGGACCTTRMKTGFGVPQFSAILECAKVAQKLRVPIIADGGIRDSRDVVLALAAGASTVMCGKLFAVTKESAAEKRDDGTVKYRGQASADFQKDFYGEVKAGTVPEGVAMWETVENGAQEVIDNLLGGLRSGMTYAGAKNLKELQRKAEFVQVTRNYLAESKPH